MKNILTLLAPFCLLLFWTSQFNIAQTNNCDNFKVSIERQHAACGQDDGSALVVVEGGVEPYDFMWSTGATENFIEGLGGGFYNVVVRDAEGCEIEGTAIIQDVPPPALTFDTQATICKLATGEAEVLVEGGFPPYNFEWGDGTEGAMKQGLAEGNYSVLVTDSRNCSTTESVEIGVTDIVLSVPDEVCSMEEAFELEQLHEGGAWTGEGVFLENETYLFKPTEAGAGAKLLTYIVEGCEAMMTAISVKPTPNAEFFAPEGLTCINDGDIIFQLFGDEGGTFFVDGTAIEGNVWTPTGGGIVSVVYEVIANNSCSDKFEREVEVIDVFNPNWTTKDGGFTVCESDLPLALDVEMMGGTWTSDINSSIEVQDGVVVFDAEIEDTDHGAFSVNYEGGGANCGQAQTHVINVYNIPQKPEVSYISQVECASEGAVVQMIGNPSFCNCPITFNVYAEDEGLIYEGQTLNEDVVDLQPFLQEGTNVFEVVTRNKVCESEVVEIVFEVESAVNIEVESENPNCNESNGSIVVTASGGAGDYFYSWTNGVIGASNTDLENGDYTVIVTDAEGCTAAQQITLVSENLPVVDLGATQTIEEGQTIVLNAANSGATFLWSTGATTQTIIVTQAGIYTVTVTNVEGCSTTASVSIENDLVGINPIEGLESWNLYPNPVQNQLVLELDLSQKMDLQIEVLDLTGRIIESEKYLLQNSRNQLSFDTSDWASGMYWVVLKDGNGVNVQKVVKR